MHLDFVVESFVFGACLYAEILNAAFWTGELSCFRCMRGKKKGFKRGPEHFFAVRADIYYAFVV